MLAEHAARGTVSLRRFWVRRARRLLPAALAYASNWYLVVVETSYFATESRPSPLLHL